MTKKHKDKEPWFAAFLSLNIPGLGQIYVGRKLRGLIWLLLFIFLFFVTLQQLLSLNGKTIIAIISGFLVLLIWLTSWFDAWRIARNQNSTEFESIRRPIRDPLLAAFLSSIWPGIGQFYLRRWFAGIIFSILVPAIIAGIFIWLIFIKKLVVTIEFRELGHLTFYALELISILLCFTKVPRKLIHKNIIPVILCLTVLNIGFSSLFPFIQKNTFEFFKVSSSSMLPTLKKSDRVVCNNKYYQENEINRGDIAIFRFPGNNKTTYIKRCVGIPGDRLKIKDGKLYINETVFTKMPKVLYTNDGLFSENPAIFNFTLKSILKLKTGRKIKEWIFINGKKYSETEGEINLGNHVKVEIIVPPENIFILGDNSAHSLDSRYWGFVPISNIQGKVSRIYWPLSRENILQ